MKNGHERSRLVGLHLLGLGSVAAFSSGCVITVDEQPRAEPGDGGVDGAAPSVQEATLWYAGKRLWSVPSDALAGDGTSVRPLDVDALDVAVRDGHVWLITSETSLARYPSSSIERAIDDEGAPVPDLVLRSAALTHATNLVIAPGGELWVVNAGSPQDSDEADGELLRFELPADARGETEIEPSAVVHAARPGDHYKLGSLAFDSAGALWVTSFTGILRYDAPGDLSGDTRPTPGAVLEKDGFRENVYFYSVAFDAQGALWAASGDGYHYLASVSRFEQPEGWSGRISPEASATLAGVRDALPAGGLAFDADGALWLANYSSLSRYDSPGDLSGWVEDEPAVRISLMGDAAPALHAHLVLASAPKQE